MARPDRRTRASLDTPKGVRGGGANLQSRDRFGRFTENIARWMGTPWFIIGLTLFVIAWMLFNTLAPESMRFDSAIIGFTALTLILSLQASYAAPLILLAQNRQDDRDRVGMEQDRQRAERTQQDTEYLAREIVALRLSIDELVSRDVLRAELKELLLELERQREDDDADARADARAEVEAEREADREADRDADRGDGRTP